VADGSGLIRLGRRNKRRPSKFGVVMPFVLFVFLASVLVATVITTFFRVVVCAEKEEN
jgi:hypothetical protein